MCHGQHRKGTQPPALTAEPPPHRKSGGQGAQRKKELRQADDPGPDPEEGEEGDHEITLQRVHTAAPGGEVDREAVQGAVGAVMQQRPGVISGEGLGAVMQQRPGVISGEGLVLVEPRRGRAEAVKPHEDAEREQQEEYALFGFRELHVFSLLCC